MISFVFIWSIRFFQQQNNRYSHGKCNFCGAAGKLESFDGVKWFTIMNVLPLFPVSGRVYVINRCPRCKHYREMNQSQLKKFRTKKKKELEEKLLSFPGSPNIAIEVHKEYIAYGFHDEAGILLKTIEKKFTDYTDAVQYLGKWYALQGQMDTSDAWYEKALSMDKSNPHLIEAVARAYIRQGRLKAAEMLLVDQGRPFPGITLNTIWELGKAYLKVNDKSRTYYLYKILATYSSTYALNNVGFRQSVRRIEKKIGIKKTILPKKKKKLAIPILVSAIAGILVFSFTWAQIDISRHQPLYIVNNLPVAVTVELPGDKLYNVKEGDVTKTTFPEGKHIVTVTTDDEQPEKIPIHITNNIFDRISNKNAFIINVHGAGILLWQEVVYTNEPYPGETLPYELYIGEPLVSLHNLDYIFEEFPETLLLEEKNILRVKGVQILNYTAEDFFQSLPPGVVSDHRLLSFLEAHIPYNLESEILLSGYFNKIVSTNQYEQGIVFLRPFLETQPVYIELHRMYQTIPRTKDQKKILLKEYDHFIVKYPGNSAFYYLRARIEDDSDKAGHFYNKSIELDKKNPHPWHGKAYNAYCNGDYGKAEKYSTQARNLAPSIERIIDLNIKIRFALGDYQDLEKELSLKVTENPAFIEYLEFLLQMDIASNKTEEAKKRLGLYKYQLNNQFGDEAYGLYTYAEMSFLYYIKDFNTYKEKALEVSNKENGSTSYLFIFYFETGDMAQAEQAAGEAIEVGGYYCLLLWLGWLEKGNREKAGFWLDQAKERFEGWSEYGQSIAGLFFTGNKGHDSILTSLKGISIDPSEKRILAATLARLYPGEQDALLSFTEKLNYNMNFPYHFLKKLCGKE